MGYKRNRETQRRLKKIDDGPGRHYITGVYYDKEKVHDLEQCANYHLISMTQASKKLVIEQSVENLNKQMPIQTNKVIIKNIMIIGGHYYRQVETYSMSGKRTVC